MRCLSLWQPWASALFAGMEFNPAGVPLKVDETRNWSTAYRGPLVIHAAKKKTRPGVDFDPALMNQIKLYMPHAGAMLPYGALLGVVEQVGCQPTPDLAWQRTAAERAWGDYRPVGDDRKRRYAHIYTHPIRFADPIPWTGRQGFFEVPDLVVALALFQKFKGGNQP